MANIDEIDQQICRLKAMQRLSQQSSFEILTPIEQALAVAYVARELAGRVLIPPVHPLRAPSPNRVLCSERLLDD